LYQSQGGHHITHEINGQDEINIANLRNYQELVATPLATKANKSELPVSAFKFKGNVVYTSLPTSGNTIGDQYYVTDQSKFYAWNGSAWYDLGSQGSDVYAMKSDFHKQTDGWVTLTRGTDFTTTDGQVLLSIDGTTSTSGSYSASNNTTTGFINVNGFTHVNALIMRNFGLAVSALTFYDVSGVFISSYTTNTVSTVFQLIAIPSNATQMRYSYYTDTKATSLSVPLLSTIQLYNANSLSTLVTNNQNSITGIQNSKTNLSDFHKKTDGWYYLYRNTDFTTTDGTSLLSTDGTTSTSGSYSASTKTTSGFINVSGFTHISALIQRNFGLAVAAIAFYDANNIFISSYTTNTGSTAYQLVAIPSNATQIKYSYYTDVQADTQSMPHLSYIGLYNANSLSALVNTNQTNITNVQNRFMRSDALFDPSTITSGQRILASGITADANYFLSDYEAFTVSDTLYAVGGSSSTYVRFYDTNKTFISYSILNFQTGTGIALSGISGLTNVAYIQFADLLTNLNSVYVSKSRIVKKKAINQIPFNTMEHFNNGMINWWSGKNGDSLGDSLTGQNYFQKYVRQYLNLAKFSNHGIGGTKLSGAANANGDSMWMDSRINSLDSDADFLTVLGGQNDGSATIGNLLLENYDTNTYAGALNVLISKVYYKYQKLSAGYYAGSGISYSGVTQVTTAKNIIIFLCTPFYVPANADPYQAKNQANAVREIAKLWGIPVIDLGGKSGFNDGVKDVYWSTDRIHPLELGHSDRLAPVMIGELEQFKPVDYTKAYYV
jgi:hypothetical protein